jgi:hypothetical protein
MWVALNIEDIVKESVWIVIYVISHVFSILLRVLTGCTARIYSGQDWMKTPEQLRGNVLSSKDVFEMK